jgi:hypothetical protein
MSKPDSASITIEALEPSARNITINGRNFVDEHGRVLDLRGANVGSASKVYVAVAFAFDSDFIVRLVWIYISRSSR